MSETSTPSIRQSEAAHFGAMAADWWDPKGSSAMLHKLNPVRLAFLRECIDRHFGAEQQALRPLAGRTALDVGCGAGLLPAPPRPPRPPAPGPAPPPPHHAR